MKKLIVFIIVFFVIMQFNITANAMDIANAKAQGADAFVTVGPVTVSETNDFTAGGYTFCVQDNSGGAIIYWNNEQEGKSFISNNNLVPGSSITITAKNSSYAEVFQFVNIAIQTHHGNFTPPDPIPIDISYVYPKGEIYESCLVIISNITFGFTYQGDNFINGQNYYIYQNGTNGIVRIQDSDDPFVGTPIPSNNCICVITAILSQHYDNYQLFPLDIEIIQTLTNIYSQTNTHYVSKTGNHIWPFDTWINAATNIQAAVEVAYSGDTVLVNDGTYYPANQISVTKNITISSKNGAEKTIVNGNNKIRCFNLNWSEPIIDGFTITNGYVLGDGGGIICYGGIVKNCIISGNTATGLYNYGGGIDCRYGGIIENCIIRGNSSQHRGGGGVYCKDGGIVENCFISDNTANYRGGAIYCAYGGLVQNCNITKNSADYGGGVYCHYGLVQNCIINNNTAKFLGGGIRSDYEGIVQNCIITKNLADQGGGVRCYGANAIIQNCTINENTAITRGGGVDCWNSGTIQNCILWNNSNDDYFSNSTNRYNCIEDWSSLENGIITNNPIFISTYDFHLQNISQCINAGTNLREIANIKDIDNYPRIMDGRVDMGAYEYSGISVDPMFIDFSPLTIMEETIKVTNYGTGSFTYDAVETASWLDVEPTSSTLNDELREHIASADQSGETRDVHNGDITFAFSGGVTSIVQCKLIATNDVIANVGGPYVANQGADVLLDGSGSIGWKLKYSWKNGSESPTQFAESNIEYQTLAGYVPGDKQITLYAKDTRNPPVIGTNITTLTVRNVIPLVDIGGPYIGAVSQTISFNAKVSDAGIYDTHQIRWDFGSGWTAWENLSATNKNNSFSALGDYSVFCQVIDNYGGTNTDIAAAIIDAANEPPVAVADLGTANVVSANLPSMYSSITLDGSRSHDDNTAASALKFSWREDVVNNPQQLLSADAKKQDQVTITRFPLPGTYKFHLVVNDGSYNSKKSTEISINIPGVSGVVKAEGFGSEMPLYGVNVIVTNNVTGQIDTDATDFEGKFVIDTGSGNNLKILLERNGKVKEEIIHVAADGEYNKYLTFSPEPRDFAATTYTGLYTSAPGPVSLVSAEIVLGTGIKLSSQSSLNPVINFGSFPKLWPEDPTISYMLLIQKEGFRSLTENINPKKKTGNAEDFEMYTSDSCTFHGTVAANNGMKVGGIEVDFGPNYNYNPIYTLEDGTFTINNLMRGEYFVKLSAPDFETSFEKINIIGGESDITWADPFYINGGEFMIYGEVYDEGKPGMPVTNLSVTAIGETVAKSKKIPTDFNWLKADSETINSVPNLGYYEVMVVNGPRTLRFEADGYEEVEQTFTIEGQHQNYNIELTPIPEPVGIWIIGLLVPLLRGWAIGRGI